MPKPKVSQVSQLSVDILFHKHKNVFTVNLAKWNEETRVCCLVRKLDPVEYERYSKFVSPKEFDELSYCKTTQV
ncbi:hypothetical protein ACTXT7_010046 [Hymenolepis weldensis]